MFLRFIEALIYTREIWKRGLEGGAYSRRILYNHVDL